jgi:hypothetical protein
VQIGGILKALPYIPWVLWSALSFNLFYSYLFLDTLLFLVCNKAATFDVLAMMNVSLFADRFITVSVIGSLTGY